MSGTGAAVTELASYVPPTALRRLQADPRPPSAAAAHRLRGAVVLTDLAGFTAFAERTTREGRPGVERLQALLADYFGRLMKRVYDHGGEVVSFAGDAAITLWREDGDLDEATRMAAACALELGACLDGVPAEARLGQRIVLGAGDLVEIQIGGVEGCWESLLAGDALEQATRLGHAGAPGQVVVSPEALARLGTHGKVAPLAKGAVELLGLSSLVPRRPPVTHVLPPTAEPAVRAFVPRTLQSLLDAGHTAWLAELRRVTVLFVGLGRPDGSEAALDRLQRLVTAAQVAVFHQGGEVLQTTSDDKGVMVFATWGLSLQSHDDDAVRAVRAAMALGGVVSAAGERVDIGVATGTAFAGLRGAGTRREYALVGDVVNTAARLMGAAAGGVLCDPQTRNAASARVAFESRPPLTMKGKAEPLSPWSPTHLKEAVSRPRGALYGRDREVSQLLAHLDRLRRREPGRVVLIEGEPGIGKSSVIDALRDQAASSPMWALAAAGDPVERNTSWGAIRPLVHRVLGLDPSTPAEAQAQRVESLLAALPDGAARGPLLAGVLPLKVAPDGPAAQMSAAARAAAATDLLVDLLVAGLGSDRVLVLVEDIHWVDGASLTALEALRARLPDLLLVATARPTAEFDRDPALSRLAAEADRLHLGPLDPASAVALACARLSVDSLPEDVVRLVQDRAEGHPFFIEEIVRGLRDAGTLNVVGGRCTLVPRALTDLPDTIQGVVSGRIDALPPRERLALKVGSVWGRSFALMALGAIHPIAADQPDLPELLAGSVRLELLMPAEQEWLFSHRIIQEVAYQLLPTVQRQQLHRAAARWLESGPDAATEGIEPRLAHHWDLAGDATRALVYLEGAGAHALRDGRFHAARAFLERALALLPDGLDPAALLHRGTLERQLGDAIGGAGDLAGSRAPLERAAAVLGYALPRSRDRLVLGILGEVGRQVMFRWVGRGGGADPRRLEAARAIYQLSPVAYMAGDTPLTVYCGLRSLNLAESGPPSGVMARGYSVLHYLSGVIGLSTVSERYHARSLATADAAGDPVALGEVLYNASVYYHGAGQGQRARALLDQALLIAARHRERRAGRQALSMLGSVAFAQGCVDEARALRTQLLAQSIEHADRWNQCNALMVLGYFDVHQGRIADGVARLEEGARVALEIDARVIGAYALGLLAEAHLIAGDPAAARRVAEEAESRSAPGQSFVTLEGEAALVEVWYALQRLGQPDAAMGAARARANLARTARVFPLGRPAAECARATGLWLRGRQRAARAGWAASLTSAERASLPIEVGRTLLSMGTAIGGAEGRAHLAAAASTFRAAGFAGEAERIDRLGNGG